MGLREPQISIQTRILTICDIYDALTAADRPYKKQVPVERALDLLPGDRRPGQLPPPVLRAAREQPRRYRIMFGGAWDGTRAVETGSVDADELTTLGSDVLTMLAAALQEGGDAGDDPVAAATVLWVGLHGLAHQRLVAPGYPWPPDVEDRLVAALTGLS